MKLDIIHNGDTVRVKTSFELAGVRVIKGFSSNGLSVPRPLRFIASPFGRYLAAALVHDAMYRCSNTSNTIARNHFKLALYQLGASRLMVFTLVTGVMVGEHWCRFKSLFT